jgi:hypothetical protein
MSNANLLMAFIVLAVHNARMNRQDVYTRRVAEGKFLAVITETTAKKLQGFTSRISQSA